MRQVNELEALSARLIPPFVSIVFLCPFMWGYHFHIFMQFTMAFMITLATHLCRPDELTDIPYSTYI